MSSARPLGLCISGAKRWILHHPKKPLAGPNRATFALDYNVDLGKPSHLKPLKLTRVDQVDDIFPP
jgi:hypothetical protein